MHRSALVVLVTTLGWVSAVAAQDRPRYDRRWFYAGFNNQVNESTDRLIALVEQAAKAGYNGVVLADYKLNILDRVPDHYFRNIARLKAAAAKAGVEIIPTVCAVGYSNGLLAHDPNLAEGLPVVDAPYVIKDGRAVLDTSQAVSLKNGALEETRGDVFTGWGFQDDPGKASFADRETVHGGRASCRFQDVAKTSSSGNARLIQQVKVRPHTAYRLSAWVKSRELSSPGAFRLHAIGAGGRSLTFAEGGIESTQDWKPFEVVFNSLEDPMINVYAGLWGGGTGTLWIDDIRIEELALVNVLRRPGCPLVVKSADGKSTYEEGRDFAPVADEKLGTVPYAGEYAFDHEGAVIRPLKGSRIREGERLLVSWYHPVLTHGSQVMCCLTEPKVDAILRDQVRRVNDLLKPKTFFLSHDEIRVANWCASCRWKKTTPGKLLADNVARCAKSIRDISPGAQLVVWSDMFDPNHNAVAGYYLVDGTLAGSWEGLPRDMTIANWNGGKMGDSLRFFSGRGHKQVIAGYYDTGDLAGFTAWDAAARGTPGVDGFMYTTWNSDYARLDAYGAAMKSSR